MFKLPVCPYCKTVYDYKSVKNNKENITECYNCKKKFKISNKFYILIMLLIFLLTILLNVFILNISKNMLSGIISISIVSIISIVLIKIFKPFLVKYIKEEK